MKILVSNDDGIKSMGIDVLARNMLSLGEIKVIAPHRQQTATGKSLTFHKPIRIFGDKTISGIDSLVHDSTPALSVIIYTEFYGIPDMVVSGINNGDNTSIHSILTSGTAAVGIEAGLLDIPAIAFSMDVPESLYFSNNNPGTLEMVGKIASIFASEFNKAKLWDKILFLNVNFPDKVDKNTDIVVTDLESYKYRNYLVEREDPKGEKYYWLWGKRRENFDKTKDFYNLFYNKKITVTPVTFDYKIHDIAINEIYLETREIVHRIKEHINLL